MVRDSAENAKLSHPTKLFKGFEKVYNLGNFSKCFFYTDFLGTGKRMPFLQCPLFCLWACQLLQTCRSRCLAIIYPMWHLSGLQRYKKPPMETLVTADFFFNAIAEKSGVPIKDDIWSSLFQTGVGAI